jgi:transcriptional regulator with XRE-family HTH domain
MLNLRTPGAFGKRIEKLLQELSLTQQELAWVLGISYVTVSRWIHGEVAPSTPTEMIIRTLELVVRNGYGPRLTSAIRKREIRGGSPDVLRFISMLAFKGGTR